MRKYEWDAFRTEHLGVPATPPAIKVGDKVRVCKARWVAEGQYAAVDERCLKEGTVVSIRRELNRYSDRDRTLYEVYFDPLCTTIDGHVCHSASVTLLASYKEIYSHKPKDANFTYMFNKNSTPVVPKMETRQDKFDKMLKLAEKLKSQADALKKYSNAMYNSIALLGTDFAVTTVDEAPFISPNMDVASWYPKFMAASGADLDGDVITIRANPTLLSALDWDGGESSVIGTVEKKEVSDDGVKIYISQPPRCGKDWATKIGEKIHESLSLKYNPLPLEAIERMFPENPVPLKKHTDKDKTVKIMNGEDIMKTVDLRVKNIIHNGPCTIVFWMDNTKTIVKLKPGDTYDPHAAFCIAVAKKMYGNNSKISKIVDQFSKDVKVPETPARELSVEELKAAADKIGYRVSRKPKKK